ncbi:hypothetical protein WICMUC_002609 [Wickerhamomyces mucosus]|uniref:Succinate dehydrogenase assembly factor 4, mitochondrial n=1 Tax=Wickerhamomyces mucosus TaxID=1378264 RepID=A0A9P8PPV9_9ASCO|nr:hypothetical protein WICMUC_002609 [Wickerhamomyces mucosus]
MLRSLLFRVPFTIGKRTNFVLGSRSYSLKNDFSFSAGPPKLPKEEQEEFERLQKLANSQAAIEEYNNSISSTRESFPDSPNLNKVDIGNFSPEFMKTIPEFEGDVNPVTGEVGGPKQDPLRHGDYSFNGRVTDF